MRFRFEKIDWKVLSENKRLKFNIGLAVVLIIFFFFFFDVVSSVWKFKYTIEKHPETVGQKTVKPAEKIEKTTPPKGPSVKVAIILDDAGSAGLDYGAIYSIKEPITISVIPNLATSVKVAKNSKGAGLEVMMHLPMEPVDGKYIRYDSGMVICSSSDGEIKKIVLNDLSDIQGAVGVNNHMGSKATADERVMKDVLGALKGKHVYFIDSRTSAKSVVERIAKAIGIPTNENNLFLDGDAAYPQVESKFRKLISLARDHGSAIGIGHATRPATIAVLRKLMPEYAKEGVLFVHASELAR